MKKYIIYGDKNKRELIAGDAGYCYDNRLSNTNALKQGKLNVKHNQLNAVYIKIAEGWNERSITNWELI